MNSTLRTFCWVWPPKSVVDGRSGFAASVPSTVMFTPSRVIPLKYTAPPLTTAPGSSAMSCAKFLPLSGRFRTCCSPMTTPSSVFWVLTSGAPPVIDALRHNTDLHFNVDLDALRSIQQDILTFRLLESLRL